MHKHILLFPFTRILNIFMFEDIWCLQNLDHWSTVLKKVKPTDMYTSTYCWLVCNVNMTWHSFTRREAPVWLWQCDESLLWLRSLYQQRERMEAKCSLPGSINAISVMYSDPDSSRRMLYVVHRSQNPLSLCFHLVAHGMQCIYVHLGMSFCTLTYVRIWVFGNAL